MGDFVLRSTGPLFLNATLHAFQTQQPEIEARAGATKVFTVAEWQAATGAAHHWASTWLLRKRHLGRVKMKQPMDACGEQQGRGSERWTEPQDNVGD